MGKKKTPLIIFTTILLTYFLLTTINISDGLNHHDSIQLANAIHKTNLKTPHIEQAVNNRYGLVITYKLISYIVGEQDQQLNYINLIFGMIAIGSIFLFTQILTNNTTIALTTTTLFTFSKIWLSVSTYANSHTLNIAILFLGLYYYIKALKHDTHTYWLTATTLLLFSLTIRISNILWTPFLITLWLCRWAYFNSFDNYIKEYECKYNWKEALYITLSIISIFCFWLFNIIFIYDNDKNINFNLLQITLTNTILREGSYILIIPIFMIMIVYGWYKHNIMESLIILAIFIPNYLFIGLNSVVAGRMMLSIFYVLILAYSLFIYDILKYDKKWIVWLVLILIGFSITAITPTLQYRHNFNSGKNLGIQTAEVLNANETLQINNDYSVFINYYGNRSTAWNYGEYILVMNYTNYPEYTLIKEITYEAYHRSEIKKDIRTAKLYKKKLQ